MSRLARHSRSSDCACDCLHTHPFSPLTDRETPDFTLQKYTVALDSLPRDDGRGRPRQRFMNREGQAPCKGLWATPPHTSHTRPGPLDAVSSGPTLCLEQCHAMRTRDALHENRCGNHVGALSDR